MMMKTQSTGTLLVIVCLSILYLPANAQQSTANRDSLLRSLGNVTTKEVSEETPIKQNADTYIYNNSRSVIIKAWDEPKVKVTATVCYRGENKLSDAQWFERLGITVVNRGNFVDIRSDYAIGKYYNKNKGRDNGLFTGSMVFFDGYGENIGNIDTKRIVTIYMPKWSKLEIDNRNSAMYFLTGIGRAEATIEKGSLETQNIADLILHSKSADFDGGNIAKADIDFTNGHFRAQDIDDLSTSTSSATMIAGVVKKAVIKSTNDDYEFDEVGALTGSKGYNNLFIEKLTGKLNLLGNNADVKIMNVAPVVDTIKLTDRYGNIRLHLATLKNYAVTFNGPYSKTFAGFEKKPTPNTEYGTVEILGKPVKVETVKVNGVILPDSAAKKQIESIIKNGRYGFTTSLKAAKINGTIINVQKDPGSKTRPANNIYVINGLGYVNIANNNYPDEPTRFTAAVGNGSGPQMIINCQNCTVDFK